MLLEGRDSKSYILDAKSDFETKRGDLDAKVHFGAPSRPKSLKVDFLPQVGSPGAGPLQNHQ